MPSRLARGERVGERYRLEQELGSGSRCVTWRATDERLDRPVALRLFDLSIDRRQCTKRAGIAASLTHPRVVRVFDTGTDDGRFFTVSELLPASLRTVRLPLSADEALRTANDVTEALAYAHERGVVHGNLHEGNVLLSEGGAKVGDFALAAAEGATKEQDLRGFGALLRRVTRIHDANAPVGFTRIVEGLSHGAYASASVVLDELRALRPQPRPPVRPTSRRLWLTVIVAALAAAVAFGVMQLGERSPDTTFVPGGSIEGTPLDVTSVDDHDPLGDNAEGPRSVSNIADGDPQTFWSTERYSAGPDFSGLKEGVGVIFDLGAPVEVGKAQVLFPAPGCSFELRSSVSRDAPVGEWVTAATITDSPQSAPIVFDAAQAQYWLLWITQLTDGVPGAGNSSACAVSEVELFAP